MRLNNIIEGIGNTPHIRLNRLFGAGSEVWMKLERNNIRVVVSKTALPYQ